MTPSRWQKLRRALNRRQPDLTVLMENVHKPHNFSAILRTCDAVGVLDAHGVWPRAFPTFSETSGGANQWVGITRHTSVEEAATHLKAKGIKLAAAHLTDTSIGFRKYDYTQPTALVLGQEKDGVTPEMLALCDHVVEVPMTGMIASLNVSVAAAVFLYEAQRQREAAGLYDTCRLSDATYRERLFRWAYPDIAKLCDRNKVELPAFDLESGEITGAFPRGAP